MDLEERFAVRSRSIGLTRCWHFTNTCPHDDRSGTFVPLWTCRKKCGEIYIYIHTYKYIYWAFHNVLRDYKHNQKTKEPTLMELFTAFRSASQHCHVTSLYYWLGLLQQGRISMHPCLRMCGKNWNIVSMCAMSPMVHTSNIFSCQKKHFPFFCVS
jgi:hypothetical protein